MKVTFLMRIWYFFKNVFWNSWQEPSFADEKVEKSFQEFKKAAKEYYESTGHPIFEEYFRSKGYEHIGCEKETENPRKGQASPSPSQEPKKSESLFCFKCKHKLYYATGIGAYCPNRKCNALDYQPFNKRKVGK